MISLTVALLLAASSAPSPDVACVAERLKPFVSPVGVRQAWPRAAQLPSSLASELGTLVSDQGSYEDGYSHWVVIDASAAAAYVVQRGGFAGTQIVFGPLPVASCATAS
jgi:hypothetical protein